MRVRICKPDYALRSRGCSRFPVNRDRKFSHFPASSIRWTRTGIVSALNQVQLSSSCSCRVEKMYYLCRFNGGILTQIVGSVNVPINILQHFFVIHMTAEEISRESFFNQINNQISTNFNQIEICRYMIGLNLLCQWYLLEILFFLNVRKTSQSR